MIALRLADAFRHARPSQETRSRIASVAMWFLWGLAAVYGFDRVFHEVIFGDWSLYGSHDWDSHVAYRYISVLSLRKYGEMPWFSPWFCHGFPAWAYVEGASNIISPYLPIYLIAPINVAARIEAVANSAIGLLGAFFLARRFTRSFALATLVGFLYVLNSRWALQFQAGHSWHFQYAWIPWVFFLFDKSCREGTVWHAVGAGLMFGLIVTTGGIYPAPHAALALPVYCLGLMATLRSWRPLGRAIILAITAFGFSAPKLVPLALLMGRFPRLVKSPEALNLDQFFSLLTKPGRFRMPDWGWHEYGCFIGVVPLIVILVALLLPSPRGTRVFRVLGVLFALLGMGAFSPYAPWSLLHEVPPFASQHVPSRFMLVALLFFGIDAAVTFGALLDAFFRRFPRLNAHYRWFDSALLLGVVVICGPMFDVSRDPVSKTFERPMLPITVSEHFQQSGPVPSIDYVPKRNFGATLPAMFANVGADKVCHTVPRFPVGAINREDRRYRGEAYFREGPGEAEVVHFTPNTADVTYRDAPPNAVLVYNMNYHLGWSANGEPALEDRLAVATRVPGGSGTVHFAYRPPGLAAGIAIGAVFLIVLAYAWSADRMRLPQRLRERKRKRKRDRERDPQPRHDPLPGA